MFVIYNKWIFGLAQFQAKESTDIPDNIYEKILNEIKKQRLLNKSITPKQMRAILKKLNYNKYYEHVQHIINKVSGKPPPRMTREVEENLEKCLNYVKNLLIYILQKIEKIFLVTLILYINFVNY